MNVEGKMQGDTVVIDPASLNAAIEMALASRKDSAPTVAEHEENILKGWLPALKDVQDDLIGGFAAIAGAKVIAKAVGPLGHPVAADLATWLALKKLNVLKGGQLRAAQTVLVLDAIRAALPVVDNTINQVVASVPVLLPGAPINLSLMGSLPAGTAAMRETASQSDGETDGVLRTRSLITNV